MSTEIFKKAISEIHPGEITTDIFYGLEVLIHNENFDDELKKIASQKIEEYLVIERSKENYALEKKKKKAESD
jgi:hypothetical protein